MKDYKFFKTKEEVLEFVAPKGINKELFYLKDVSWDEKVSLYVYRNCKTVVLDYDQATNSFVYFLFETALKDDPTTIYVKLSPHQIIEKIFESSLHSVVRMDTKTMIAYEQKKTVFSIFDKNIYCNAWVFTKRAKEKFDTLKNSASYRCLSWVNQIANVCFSYKWLSFAICPIYRHGKKASKNNQDVAILKNADIDPSEFILSNGNTISEHFIKKWGKNLSLKSDERVAVIRDFMGKSVLYLYEPIFDEHKMKPTFFEVGRGVLNGIDSPLYFIAHEEKGLAYNIGKIRSFYYGAEFYFEKSDEPYNAEFRFKKAASAVWKRKKEFSLYELLSVSADSFGFYERLSGEDKHNHVFDFIKKKRLSSNGKNIPMLLNMNCEQIEKFEELLSLHSRTFKSFRIPKKKETLAEYFMRMLHFVDKDIADVIVKYLKEYDQSLFEANNQFEEYNEAQSEERIKSRIVKNLEGIPILFSKRLHSFFADFGKIAFPYISSKFDFKRLSLDAFSSLITAPQHWTTYSFLTKIKNPKEKEIIDIAQSYLSKNRAVFENFKKSEPVSDEEFGKAFAYITLFGYSSEIDDLFKNMETGDSLTSLLFRYIAQRREDYAQNNLWIFRNFYIDNNKAVQLGDFYADHYINISYAKKENLEIDSEILNFRVRPRDIVRKHDFLSEFISIYKIEKKSEKEKEKMERREKSFQSRIEKIKKYEFSNADFSIIVPESQKSVLMEGYKLKHCVGGYLDRISSGNTNILFLRRNKEVDKPFMTMEIASGEISQVYGLKNSGILNQSDGEKAHNFVKDFAQKNELSCNFVTYRQPSR